MYYQNINIVIILLYISSTSLLLNQVSSVTTTITTISPLENLRIEYVPTPVQGITVRRPRFSWSLPSSSTSQSDRGLFQTAYHIILENNLTGATIWDSGIELLLLPAYISCNNTNSQEDPKHFLIFMLSSVSCLKISDTYPHDSGFVAISTISNTTLKLFISTVLFLLEHTN